MAFCGVPLSPQERRIIIDGPLPSRIELEPVTAIVSLTMWTPDNPAAVIDAANYDFVSRDPRGTSIEPVPWGNWPQPERALGSFAVTYMAGWKVTDTENNVPRKRSLDDRTRPSVSGR